MKKVLNVLSVALLLSTLRLCRAVMLNYVERVTPNSKRRTRVAPIAVDPLRFVLKLFCN